MLTAVRDFIEGPRIINPIFAHQAIQNGSDVVLHRQYINGSTTIDAIFMPLSGTQLQVSTTAGSISGFNLFDWVEHLHVQSSY